MCVAQPKLVNVFGQADQPVKRMVFRRPVEDPIRTVLLMCRPRLRHGTRICCSDKKSVSTAIWCAEHIKSRQHESRFTDDRDIILGMERRCYVVRLLRG
jgi:hypothetical protein